MEQDMKENGNLDKLVGKASFIMQMVIYTKVNGTTTKQMGMEAIQMQREQCMKDIGRMINNMEKV